ncbi:AraC family transcriptional regulator [Maribacter litopenaei]|uniref:AraC family transcriptional regulator n=1 Tax=Maribacter litopenaei TaxID=2976127 RepID=A0ABY5Y5W2_9FLAO|nr:AraC family transcriptional regulator [Maribacter litopenaei]UWX54403.1 AraC family transcriptional regulator [Maribacter litopenaei]
MKFELTYDIEKLLLEVIEKEVCSLGMAIECLQANHLKLSGKTSEENLHILSKGLTPYGIKIEDGDRMDLLAQIKSLIKKYVKGDYDRNVSISKMLSEETGYSYSYLSNHFTSQTFTTIENFYVLIRIEKVKELLMDDDRTLSDIAYSLNFSSVPHLSSQFKKVTGLTITQYLKIRNNTINTIN